MIQHIFAEKAKDILQQDHNIIGMAAGGSWLTQELDDYSDLDLVIVTKQKIGGNREAMLAYAEKLGTLLTGFTGEHVGEPRVLICLYDAPLLHVDLKFVTLQEFRQRVEDPELLLDKDNQLAAVIRESSASFPGPEFQWIEDRFWIWIHYALLKIGRGEYLEAFDFLAYLRMVVFGPLMHLRQGNLPRGVRKVETQLPPEALKDLLQTIPAYNRTSLLQSLEHSVSLYRQLRAGTFPPGTQLHTKTEDAVMKYLEQLREGE